MATALIVGGLAFIIVTITTWLYLQHSASVPKVAENTVLSKPTTPELDRNKLHIFIVRFAGYRGATEGPKEEDMHRYIMPSEPLRLSDKERSFAWGIDNENASTLHNVRLSFYYYGKVPLQIIRTHLKEEGHYWQEYLPGSHYFFDFRVINSRWAHSWGSLIVKFPEPGEYRFDLTATGDEIVGDPVKTYLRVIVDESAFL